METADAHFECVEPLFDEVPVGIVDPTVQSALSSSEPPRSELSVERLMWSVAVVVVHEMFKTLADALPIAHPRIMEAVDPHFEGVKPLFNEVSVGIVDPTAQSDSRERSPIAELQGVIERLC
jgi:hypothetical protein